MATVTLSSKFQVTLPMEIVRSMGLKPGDKLITHLIEDHIVLLPQPKSWVDYFAGSMQGVYGSTKEEIDRYIAEVRHGWDIDALKDALALDKQLQVVYDATSSTDARSPREIAERSGVEQRQVIGCLDRLEELDAVKRLEHPTLKAEPHYRRIP